MAADVLFIHPGNRRQTYQELGDEFCAIAPPVWTSLLAEVVRQAGTSVAIYDANLLGWDEAGLRRLLEDVQPRLVVLMVYGHQPSASTQTMPAAIRIARELKLAAPELLVALGGIHPTALPELTLRESGADLVLLGEARQTLLGLCDWLGGRGQLAAIPGLARREGDRCLIQPPPPLAGDLDTAFPDHAWDLLPPLSSYRAHNMHCFQEFARSTRPDFADVRSPYAVLYSSLGCPFQCSYCCINSVFGQRGARTWSVERVVGWIDRLVTQHGVRNLRFDDELFVLSPTRLEAICDALIARGHNLNLWVYGRVDTIAEKLLAKMKRAGFTWICLGIEAGEPAVRAAVGKRFGADVERVVKAIQGHGMHVLGNFMFGLPDDTAATMQATLDLALRLQCDFVNFYSVMAYPGSALYEQNRHRPGVLPPSWSGYSQHSVDCQPLPSRHLSAAEILRFRDAAFERYFTDPAYLAMVSRRFGGAVVGHLERMVSMKLQRRLLQPPSSG